MRPAAIMAAAARPKPVALVAAEDPGVPDVPGEEPGAPAGAMEPAAGMTLTWSFMPPAQ
jgi:hypothetical protein